MISDFGLSELVSLLFVRRTFQDLAGEQSCYVIGLPGSK